MVTFTPLEPVKGDEGRADLQTEHVRQLLFQKAQTNITWEQSCACPCNARLTLQNATETLNGPSNESRASCAACAGKGRIYYGSQTIKAILLSQEKNPKLFEAWGEQAPGSIRLELPTEILPSFMDRFTVLDNYMVRTEVRERKVARAIPAVISPASPLVPAPPESLTYPIVTRTMTTGTPGYPTVPTSQSVSVLYCRATDANGVIAGSPLTLGTHFTVDSQGRIVWTLGDILGVSPAIGAWYAVSYYIHPVYVARSFPHVYRETMTKPKGTAALESLPVAVDAWLEWLVSP